MWLQCWGSGRLHRREVKYGGAEGTGGTVGPWCSRVLPLSPLPPPPPILVCTHCQLQIKRVCVWNPHLCVMCAGDRPWDQRHLPWSQSGRTAMEQPSRYASWLCALQPRFPICLEGNNAVGRSKQVAPERQPALEWAALSSCQLQVSHRALIEALFLLSFPGLGCRWFCFPCFHFCLAFF